MKEYDIHKKTIVVDVDNVVVETGLGFVNWTVKDRDYLLACEVSDVDPLHHALTNYNPTVGLTLSDESVDRIFSWWRNRNLYQMFSPMEGSVDVLQSLSESYNIVFVSHVEGNHGKSKVKFLKKYFPFMSGYAACRQKNIIRSDYIIDDRLIHLKNLPTNTTPLLFESSWGNGEHNIQIVNWENIHKYIQH